MGLVLVLATFGALGALAGGCAAPVDAPEVTVDTNGHVTANGVQPMLMTQTAPCESNPDPQTWTCRPTTRGGSQPVHATESAGLVLGYKSLPIELVQDAPPATATTPPETGTQPSQPSAPSSPH